ncbi:MAG: putative copper resistance protein [Actinomycetia bacterium]|nr:putative copper resistance protein [Actinomycetes bacterium]
MLADTWQVLGTWTFAPFPGLVILVTAAAYVAAAVTVSRRNPGRPWPAARTACFLGGLLLAWIVILGPVGAYDDVFFWAHMVQHIVLMMIIAPLLLLGRPVLLLLRVTRPEARRRMIVPVLRSRAVRVLTDPVLTWLLFAGTLIGTHFSPFYNYALYHPAVHDYVEHPLYLGVALLYYYPLLDGSAGQHRTPHGARVVSLGLMMMPEALTGFFIYAQGHVLYSWYVAVARPFGPNPLTDQQIGGAMMWGGGMLLDTGWMIVAVAAWLNAEQAKTRRIDAELARQQVPACPA